MSPEVSPSFLSFFPLSYQRCRFALRHQRRFPTSPPPPQSDSCHSRLISPQPPCFLTRSRFSYARNSPIIVFLPCPAIGDPPDLLVSRPIAQPSDLLFMTVVLSSLSPAPHMLPLSLPIQPRILPILLPFTGCGSLDHSLSFEILLLFSQEFLKLLTCFNNFILCNHCWLVVWLICFSVNVFSYLCSFILSFVCQVYLLVILWTWFRWLSFSRPVCSIDFEEDKGIVILGLVKCYPLDFWFSGKFEMTCFEVIWRIDYWMFVWSQLLLPEDLALLYFNPGYLMAWDPEGLVSKASPRVTSVTCFVYSMYQSLFLMPQFTGGVVCISLGLLDTLYYGFSPDFMFNEN